MFAIHRQKQWINTTTMKFIIVSVCNGIGLPLLVTKQATEAISTNYGQKMDIMETHIFETSEDANKMANSILQYIHYPGKVFFHGDANQFPQFAEFIIQKTGTQ